MHEKDIRFTKPNVDCKFCELHHFIDFATQKATANFYAVCTNQVKTFGCVSIDITVDGNPLFWETKCSNCKLFVNNNQLELF